MPGARGAGATVDRQSFPYRMKDLCERAGLSRQVVHFYVQQGLLPEGHKTGRNMAWYGEAHLERLRLIRQLQEERFLPLKAIRAMLDEKDEAFTPRQRELIHEVRQRLGPTLGAGADASATVDAAELLRRTGVKRAELDRMVELGLLATRQERGRTVLAFDDVYIVELWGQLRTAGFTAELGFTVDDLSMYVEAMSGLLANEARLLAKRLSGLPPGQGAELVRRALPLINTFLARYHTTQARNFLAAH
ncbi:MerR family transcriptional regulator [Myxococcus sp. RHSTA-1-4]|uniref:MerR family transcriptional regulator n=1 Tax=Myxococcus sp. RHSTA-1-4 TaxID=2874601 RepID=UPI001CBB16D4|nr:MerR family transcriptional regulator [Myxococcus sp. RHSTA-1-4]MBZ4419857.1 MerR family transcriptional regulator [Myxococcus sp. RHSTA-1-4]